MEFIHIPDLHEDIDRNRKLVWFTWAHEFKEGASFFASARVAANLCYVMEPELAKMSKSTTWARLDKFNRVAIAKAQGKLRVTLASKQVQKKTGEYPSSLLGFQSRGLLVPNLRIIPKGWSLIHLLIS